MEEFSLKINKYKCFRDESYHGFEKICPINVIIGKNNSGKSSLTDTVEMCFSENRLLPESSHILICTKLLESDIGSLGSSTSRGSPSINDNEYLKSLIGRNIFLKKSRSHSWYDPKVDGENGGELGTDYANYLRSISDRIKNRLELTNKNIRKINAERDIRPEGVSSGDGVSGIDGNGQHCTQLLRQLFHEDKAGKIVSTSDLIKLKKIFLNELNSIIEPEMSFVEIEVRTLVGTDKGEIFLHTEDGNIIPLSQMGSGLKTIILVLTNLLLKPALDSQDKNNYIFILEELENNLHPAMQRRLYDYIKRYSEENTGCYFFITTHSNITIDSFGNYERSQTLHITTNDSGSHADTILNIEGQKKILEELDFRASDLLQTNGIIWVEGPSDRIYINKWLLLKYPTLKEGTHYTVMFYGGRLLSHLSFRDAEIGQTENFIELLKINRNAYIVIDLDANSANDNLNTTKSRIETEIGINHVWITQGREIENYLSNELLKKWVSQNHSSNEDIELGKYDKIDERISAVKYGDKKVKYALEIIEHMTVVDIHGSLDLETRIDEIGQLIMKWNKISKEMA